MSLEEALSGAEVSRHPLCVQLDMEKILVAVSMALVFLSQSAMRAIRYGERTNVFQRKAKKVSRNPLCVQLDMELLLPLIPIRCATKSQSAMRAIRYGDAKLAQEKRNVICRNPLCVQLDMEA